MHIGTPVRRRLLDRLDTGSGLTVVHASAGSGKTTLLRSWAHELTSRGRPVLWVHLTPETSRTQQVRDAVSAAITETGVLEGLTGKRAETLRSVGDEMPAREALGTLFSTLPGLVLVIDGGEHVTEDPDLMWGVLLALVSSHPGSRVVLATRWLHSQRAELLALNPTVDLVGEDTLLLTTDEVAEVVSGTSAPQDASFVTRLTTETQGHPRALVAALLATLDDPAAGEATWQRLLRAHTLDDLDRIGVREALEAVAASPLCDVDLVTRLSRLDHDEAGRALHRVEAHGYGRWRDAADGNRVLEVTAAARTAVGSGSPVHAEAVVEWLVERDELGHALEAALRSGLLERATSLYRRLLVIRPFDVTATFDRTLRTVPTEELLRHPMLAVARGVALLASPATQPEAATYLEPIASQDPAAVRLATPDDELMDLTAQSVVLGVLGRPGPSTAAALEAARRLEDHEFARQVDPQILTPLACMLSQALMDAGHVPQAQRLISRGVVVAPPEMVHYTALYGRAWYALDGRLTEALDVGSRVGQGTDLPGAEAAGVTWGPRTRAVEALGAGVLHLDRWELDAAAAAVEQEQAARWDPSQPWREWLRLHVALASGDHDPAVRGVTTSLEEAGGPPQASLGTSALANVVAICWLAVGNVARANRALQWAPEHPGQTAPARLLLELTCAGPESTLHLATQLREADGHTVRSRAAVETLAAAAALRTGADLLAGQLLDDAAALHAEHACRAHLLYVPATDSRALARLAEETGSAAATAYLGSMEVSASLPEVAPRVSLSTRERAVLEALAAHRSRADIAHALHVSENTVKSQLRSIYRKLDVTQRADAITRALELDLLREEQARAL